MDSELKNKVKRALQNTFVGDFVFSSDELEELYNTAENLIPFVYKSGTFVGGSLDEMGTIFVAFVNACKDWGSSEDSFYDFLDKKFNGAHVSRDLVVGIIDKLSLINEIFVIKGGKRYYATMLSHSLSPISSLNSFFDMCWEIYCEDLGQQYVKGDPVCKLIVENLQNKFRGRNLNEDISIGSKIYSFRVGLTALLYSKPSAMEELLDDTLLSIDMLFNNEPIILAKYTHILLKDWWSNKSLHFGDDKERKQRIYRENIVTDYSQIQAKFVLLEGIAKLVIPVIRLADNFEYNPYISIIVNGNEIVTEEMKTTGSGLIMSTSPKSYELANLSNQNYLLVRVVITHCGKTIYDSKGSLVREFIVFNKDGKEVRSGECLPGLYFLYVKDLKQLMRYPFDMHKTNEINTYSFESFHGDVIQGTTNTVFFVDEKTSRDIYFFVKEKNDLTYREDGEDYRVIDGELYLDVRNESNINDIGVRYEEAHFKLSEFKYEELPGIRRYELSSLLNVGEPQKLTLFRFSDNFILASINIIKFNNIRIKFDKELYYGNNEVGTFEFKTEKYHAKTSFNITDEEICVSIENGQIIPKVPKLRWKIDDGEWFYSPIDKPLWYKEITNSSMLQVDIPKEISCSLLLSNNKSIERQANKPIFKLGQTIYSLAFSQSLLSGQLTAIISTNLGDKYVIGDIYFKEHFSEKPIFVNSLEKKIVWDPSSFIGDRDSTFKLEFKSKEKTLATINLNLDLKIINCEDFGDGYYDLTIKLLGKGFLAREETFYHEKIILGSIKEIKFKDKIIRLHHVVSFESSARRKELRPVYIGSIKYIKTVGNLDYYSGLLFMLGANGKKVYLNFFNDCETSNRVKINPVRIELKSDRSCYLGYGLDLMDEDCDYDDEFTLDYKNRISIGNMTEGKKNSSIDYFIFEVIDHV